MFRKNPSVYRSFFLILALATSLTASAQNKPKPVTLKSLDGSSVSLGDYLGKQTVVLNFWAAWCDTCEEEIPELVKLQNSSGGAAFFGINAGESAAVAKKFVDRAHYPYRVLLDADKSVAKSYGVVGVPRTIVISKSGSVVYSDSAPPAALPASAR